MNEQLQEIVDGVRIEAISVTRVPAPPHSRFPGEHLFVNCLYAATVAVKEPIEALAIARSDLLAIVRLLSDKKLLSDTRSLCVSFLGNRTANDSERIYRYSVGCESYPTDANLMKIDSLLDADGSMESSDIDVVAELL